MLTINGITVRLGGRTILDRATAAIPPGSKVGLIGRNGAGKSTLMKVIVGQLEADEGEIEMPRRTRLGYIAQEAPTRHRDPVRDRARRRYRARRPAGRGRALHDPAPARRHPRPAARDRRLCAPTPAPRGSCSASASTRRCRASRSTAFRRLEDARRARRLAVLGARRAAARRAFEPPRPRSDPVAREFPQGLCRHADRHQPRARPAQQRRRHHPPPRARQDQPLFRQLRRVREAARRARRADRRRAGLAGRAARAPAGLYRPQQRPRLDRQAGPVAAPRCWPRCSRSPRWSTIPASASISPARPN